MAKKVTGYIKLQIPAGKATPAPPVGPALGSHGVNIVQFTKEFNARTAKQGDMIIPVVITVYADRSFSFITKTPPAAVLLKKACNLKSASGTPNKEKVASISKDNVCHAHFTCSYSSCFISKKNTETSCCFNSDRFADEDTILLHTADIGGQND